MNCDYVSDVVLCVKCITVVCDVIARSSRMRNSVRTLRRGAACVRSGIAV